MGLSVTERGFLDKMIDKEIAQIPSHVRRCRDPQTKAKFQLKEPDDFVFGIAFGSIMSDFTTYHSMIYNRSLTQEEMEEAVSVINKRMVEIRNAIFNCG